MIERAEHVRRVRTLLRQFPVVAIVGARQVGKTTLAQQVHGARGPVHRFDLESERDRALLSEPLLALEGLRGLVVLDEIQRRPDLFPALRVLADRRPVRARFLVLGSASPELLRQSSESLAGRIAYYPLDGLSLEEVGHANGKRLWLRGKFPRSYLARTVAESARWRDSFIRTFVERDLPQLGVRIDGPTIERFWAMLAHYHGQLWSSSELARAFGVADHTVRRYLDLLVQTFMVRRLDPWHENLAKRQVKSPRIYIGDSGVLHALLRIDSAAELERHARVGASWEGFALSEVVARLNARWDECHFWRTHTGAELDLLVVRGRTRLGFEFKRTQAPSVTPSMRSALADLGLRRIDVIHAGDRTFSLSREVRAVGFSRILDDLEPLAWR
jgi:hypothetical protein